MCTISGTKGPQNLFNLPIDKLCEKWYNGKFGAPQPSARRQFYHTFGILSIQKNHLFQGGFLFKLPKQ